MDNFSIEICEPPLETSHGGSNEGITGFHNEIRTYYLCYPQLYLELQMICLIHNSARGRFKETSFQV